MKIRVFKALANPALIFYVPYSLAVLNFTVQFMIFLIFFVGSIIIQGVDTKVDPVYFLLSVIAVHSFIAIYSKRDPQLGNIVTAKMQLLKIKPPRKLTA